MRKRAFIALAACAVTSGLACGRGESAEERQIAQLREGLQRVQTDADHFERRLSSLEVQSADDRQPPSHPSQSAGNAASVKTPPLRVVRLSPDGAEPPQGAGETASTFSGSPSPSTAPGAASGEDPEDASPRPSIRVSGTPVGRGKHGVAYRQQIEETIPDETPAAGAAGPAIRAGAPRPSALDPEAKRAYDGALALVNAKQYAQALEAFAAFLVKWPDHPNADNATYWRGECYFAQGEYARSAEQFEGVISRFPLGNKVPDALLKLGMSHDKLGNPQKATQSFQRLQRDFPRSEAARRIPPNRSGDAPAPRREVTP